MRGVFAIPPTPFTSTGTLDLEGLRSTVQFCVKAGVHGIVTPVNASEFAMLTDAERELVVETAVDAAAGRVPVVVGVTGASVEQAVAFARHARTSGVHSVIAMPPFVLKAGPEQIVAYYRAVAAASRLPVWVQNHMPPVGTAMPASLLVRLVTEIDGVVAVKEESYPPGQLMTAVRDLCGTPLQGLMGGMAGRHLIDEYRRGSTGTMPACEIADLHVDLWRHLEDKDWAAARTLYRAMLPLLTLESLYGVRIYKEVLRRRGIIADATARESGIPALDEFDHQELDEVLDELKPLFRL